MFVHFRSSDDRDAAFAFLAQFLAINQTLERAHPLYLRASGSSALGTMPGSSMNTEMELLVRLGLTPRSGSCSDQYLLGQVRLERHRLIAPGRRADIVVLDENPTVDIANSRKIDRVILGGESAQ